jgi:putative tricarboxylic transport membrane protein
MKKDQFWAALFWIGLGLYTIYASLRMGSGSFRSPGPGLMPLLLGVLLCLTSLYYIVTELIRKSVEAGAKENQWAKANPAKVIPVVLILLAYAVTLEWLGYLVASFLMLFVLFWVAGMKRVSAVLSSLAAVLGSYALFTYLGVVFPHGILKFLLEG